MANLLRLRGHEVFTAFDWKEALDSAARVRPDIVVLDIGMPKMSGCEVATRIRAKPWGRDVLLVALSGWGQKRDRDQSTAAGFDTHQTKPADPALLEAILADRKSCNSPPT